MDSLKHETDQAGAASTNADSHLTDFRLTHYIPTGPPVVTSGPFPQLQLITYDAKRIHGRVVIARSDDMTRVRLSIRKKERK